MEIKKKKRTRIKNRDQSKDYVNGPTLHAWLTEWQDSRPNDTANVPDKIILAINQIIDRLATRGNFGAYSYLEDMKGNARLHCLEALIYQKYDHTKYDNPFAYFTQVAWNAFVAVINEESRESYLKHKSLETHLQHMSLEGEEMTDAAPTDGLNVDLINKFETRHKITTKKKKKNQDAVDLDQFLLED